MRTVVVASAVNINKALFGGLFNYKNNMTNRTILELPQLHSLSSKGKVKLWGVKVVGRGEHVHVLSYHGYVAAKIVDELSSPILGKNIGRKNETTSEQQAILEARSKWQSKIDKNYTEAIPTSVSQFIKVRPMLAHKWVDRKHNIVFPCYVQPKLNGVRCIADEYPEDEFRFTSRNGKEYTTLRHIEEELVGLLDDLPEAALDGEIFSRELNFQEIIRGVKKEREGTKLLEYWIYDVADTTLDFEDRLEILENIAERLHRDSRVRITPTYLVKNIEELMERHKEFSLDYEGTMVRNMKGKYVYDFRSTDLQKLKDFIDAEFIIVGAKSGSGSDEGTVIYKCVTTDGKEFDVRPRGTRKQRKDQLDNIEADLGKPLTVRYQELSEDGIPIFPVGIAIRDYE